MINRFIERIKRAGKYFFLSFAGIVCWNLAADTPVSLEILRIQLATSAVYALTAMALILCLRFYADYRKDLAGRAADQEQEDRGRRQRELAEGKWEEAQRRDALKKQYANLTVEEVVFHNSIDNANKRFLLMEVHKFSWDDTEVLLKVAEKEVQKAELNDAIRKITQKAGELYKSVPSDDSRTPIPEKVRLLVWQRDGGKCAKCGSQQNLVFGRLVTLAKGGSSEEINVQLLCAACNRERHKDDRY